MSSRHERYSETSTGISDEEAASLQGLTAYVNAGGRGTRLSSIFHPHERRGVSKALLPIGQPPVALIDHQINKLTLAGAPQIVAGVGDHENVAAYIDDTYSSRNNIYAVSYQEQLGNGGDLVRAVRDYPELFADDVLIANVDTLLDIDEETFLYFHRATGAELTIALTQNKGVPNENAFHVNATGEVVYCAETYVDRDRTPPEVSGYRGSSTGALIASKEMLANTSWAQEDGPLSLYRQVVAQAIAKGAMFAYNNGDKLFMDIGTVATWSELQIEHKKIQPYVRYSQ